MKRNVIAIGLLAFVLFSAACATTTPATAEPSLQGVVSSVNGNSVTITPATGGQAVTVNLNADTRIAFTNGIEAGRAGIMTGYKVDVWTAEGGQQATKIIIK